MTAEPKAEGLVPLAAIQEAARLLDGVAVATPLVSSRELAEELGFPVALKLESLQRTGSFKFRGAFNFLSQLTSQELEKGVITYSSGNHAQAVALAARLKGVPAVVVMPTTAPQVKVEGARRLGARVVMEGTTSEERRGKAEAIAGDEGLTMVPPFDHAHIIAGQGTVGLEILAADPSVRTILVCVGGGGLLSGVAAAVKGLDPTVQVMGVEPEGAASMSAALDAGRPVTLPSISTIADGLAPVRVGGLTFRHARDLVDGVVTVDDESIRQAAAFLFHRHKLVVEFSGAAALAALRSGAVGPVKGPVAAVVTGGNLDPSLLSQLDHAPPHPL
ncbi:MAG: threonine/serine dehydratase [Gemmatimonadota bacterium]